ncbi:MAG: thioredoxin family protein [bacterium]|nr:thioredoxin family protein [bacterium]
MKNKFLILTGTIIIILVAIIIIFSIIGNNKEEYLKEINYIEYVEKVHNNESFILYVKQTDCPHCIKFTPKFNTILDKYEIEAFVINLTELDETEKDLFIKDLSVSSTPTILFFENGIELGSFSRIIGVQSEKYIINKLKQHGYIKEEK